MHPNKYHFKIYFKNSKKLSAYLTKMETKPSQPKSWGPLWGHLVRTPRKSELQEMKQEVDVDGKITYNLVKITTITCARWNETVIYKMVNFKLLYF